MFGLLNLVHIQLRSQTWEEADWDEAWQDEDDEGWNGTWIPGQWRDSDKY